MVDPGYDIVQARVNEADLLDLKARGITGPWYVNTKGMVCARLPNGMPLPVVILIVQNPKGSRVVFRDGDPLNLTRANLKTVHGPAPAHRQ